MPDVSKPVAVRALACLAQPNRNPPEDFTGQMERQGKR